MTAALATAPGPPIAAPFPRRVGERHDAYCARLLTAAERAEPPRNYVLSWAACVAYLDAGQVDRSRELASDAKHGAQSIEARAWAIRMQAEVTMRSRSTGLAAPLYEAAREAFEEAGDLRNALAMRVMLGLTRSAYDGSEEAAARRRVERNELTALLRENDPLFVGYDRTRILNAIGILHLSLGDLFHALAFFQAVDAIEGPPAPVTIRRGQLNRALVLIRVGDTKAAERLLRKALEAAPRSSQALVWRTYNLLALCKLGEGDLQGAREALDGARRSRPGTLHNDAILNEAKLLNRAGDHEAALSLLGPLEEVPAPMGGYEWMLEIARANVARGALGAAHEAVDALSSGHPGRYFLAQATVLRARLAYAEGRVEDARRQLEVADELAEAAGSLAVVEEVAEVRRTLGIGEGPRHEARYRWLDAFHARVRGTVTTLSPGQKAERGAAAKERVDHLRMVAERFAHDVASPLTVATTALDQLATHIQADAPVGLVADLRSALERLNHRRQHALVSLQQESPAGPFAETVDLRALAATLWRDVHRTGAEKDILVELRVLPVPDVRSDPEAIREVMENLLSNALKYSPRGTTVTLRLEPAPGGVAFRVTDEGPGLSPEDAAQVFHRFVRLPPKPTGGESSHGLGLHVARRLATMLGGALTVDSTLGRGSTFTLQLPLTSPGRPSRDPNPLIGLPFLPGTQRFES